MTIPVPHATACPVLRRQLRGGLRGLLCWCLGLTAVLWLYLPLYPSIQTPGFSEMVAAMPPTLTETLGFDEIATGAGYTQATYFGLLGLLIATLACVSWGAQLIAGAEESGRLELSLTHAVGRGQYALESLGTLVLRVLVLCALTLAVVLALNGPGELSLTPSHVLTTTAAWGVLCLAFGVTALSAGAASGRHGLAVGTGAAVAIASYAFDAVARSKDSLDWLSTISPYHWAFGSDPLSTGEGWAGIGLLLVYSAVVYLLGHLAFTRRDLHA